MANTSAQPTSAFSVSTSRQLTVNATPLLLLLGLLVNGYVSDLMKWGHALASGEAGLPLSVLDVMVIAVAISFIWPAQAQIRWARPYVLEIAAACAALFPSSAITLMTVIVFALARAAQDKGQARIGYVLIAGLAAANLWNAVIVMWVATWFGALDAALTQLLMSLYLAHPFRAGNVVGAGQDHSIILFYGCTTAFIVPKLMLVQAAASFWRGLKRFAVSIIITATTAWLLNIARLALMATSKDLYENMHSPTAFNLFDVVLMGLVFLVTFLAEER